MGVKPEEIMMIAAHGQATAVRPAEKPLIIDPNLAAIARQLVANGK